MALNPLKLLRAAKTSHKVAAGTAAIGGALLYTQSDTQAPQQGAPEAKTNVTDFTPLPKDTLLTVSSYGNAGGDTTSASETKRVATQTTRADVKLPDAVPARKFDTEQNAALFAAFGVVKGKAGEYTNDAVAIDAATTNQSARQDVIAHNQTLPFVQWRDAVLEKANAMVEAAKVHARIEHTYLQRNPMYQKLQHAMNNLMEMAAQGDGAAAEALTKIVIPLQRTLEDNAKAAADEGVRNDVHLQEMLRTTAANVEVATKKLELAKKSITEYVSNAVGADNKKGGRGSGGYGKADVQMLAQNPVVRKMAYATNQAFVEVGSMLRTPQVQNTTAYALAVSAAASNEPLPNVSGLLARDEKTPELAGKLVANTLAHDADVPPEFATVAASYVNDALSKLRARADEQLRTMLQTAQEQGQNVTEKDIFAARITHITKDYNLYLHTAGRFALTDIAQKAIGTVNDPATATLLAALKDPAIIENNATLKPEELAIAANKLQGVFRDLAQKYPQLYATFDMSPRQLTAYVNAIVSRAGGK